MVSRNEFTGFEWISNIGGLSFLFSIGAMISSSVDTPAMLVTAAMLAKGKIHRIYSAGASGQTKSVDKSMINEESVQEGCCMDLRTRLATNSCLPHSCKKRIGGAKARILNRETKKLSS